MESLSKYVSLVARSKLLEFGRELFPSFAVFIRLTFVITPRRILIITTFYERV